MLPGWSALPPPILQVRARSASSDDLELAVLKLRAAKAALGTAQQLGTPAGAWTRDAGLAGRVKGGWLVNGCLFCLCTPHP